MALIEVRMLKSLMKITYIFIAVLLMLSSCTNWKGDNGGGNNNNTPTPVCVPPVNVIYVKWDATGRTA